VAKKNVSAVKSAQAIHPRPSNRRSKPANQRPATHRQPRRLNRGDVYLLHTHHRIECALCFITASR